MNREDIIRMARQVRDGGHWNQLDLINFAALVAAAEREACAKVCQEKWIYTASGFEMADYIRTRSNT